MHGHVCVWVLDVDAYVRSILKTTDELNVAGMAPLMLEVLAKRCNSPHSLSVSCLPVGENTCNASFVLDMFGSVLAATMGGESNKRLMVFGMDGSPPVHWSHIGPACD